MIAIRIILLLGVACAITGAGLIFLTVVFAWDEPKPINRQVLRTRREVLKYLDAAKWN